MKKLALAVSLGVASVMLASCGGHEKCTPELIEKKGKELQAAIQEVAIKDPSKAQAVIVKAGEIMSKYKDVKEGDPQVCKVIDETIAAVKG